METPKHYEGSITPVDYIAANRLDFFEGNVVKYNHSEFPYFEGIRNDLGIDEAAYLTITKLTAILRVANGLDRSHRQKFKNIKAVVKENDLIITTVNTVDTTLERGLFKERAAFFEEVFSIKPIIRLKQKE